MNDETDATHSPLRLFADQTSIEITRAYVRHPKQFEKDFKRPVRRLRRRLMDRIGPGLYGEEAAACLSDYLQTVEADLGRLLSNRSVYYWLHLCRRVAPWPIDGLSAHTCFLARRILHLAICKYGSVATQEAVDADFEVVDGVSRLRDVGYFDSVAVYSAEYLAYEYWHATARYRVVCKGGKLQQNGNDYSTTACTDLARLIDLIDSRAGKGSFFGAVGAVDFDGGTPVNAIILPLLNVERKPYPLDTFFGLPVRDWEGRVGTLKTNYLPDVFQLDELTTALDPFAVEVVAATGLTPAELAIVLEAIWWRVAWRLSEKPEYAYEYLQRGWLLYRDSPGTFCRDVAACFAATDRAPVPQRDLEGLVHGLVERFTLTPAVQPQIDLWTRSPSFLAIPVGNGLLIDLTAIMHLALEAAYDVGTLDGAPGATKGDVFETQVGALLESRGVVLWNRSVELTSASGAKREVDVSFVVGDQLFIVECKAFAHTYRLDKGDFWPINQRWEQLVDALDQAGTLVDFLKNNPTGANYTLPAEVARFTAIVCTPHTEWIPSSDPAHWLTDEIPVFCTPCELVEFLERMGHIK